MQRLIFVALIPVFMIEWFLDKFSKDRVKMKRRFLFFLWFFFPFIASAHLIRIDSTSPFPSTVTGPSTVTATYTVINTSSIPLLGIQDQSQLPAGMTLLGSSTCGSNNRLLSGASCTLNLQLQAPDTVETLNGFLRERATPSLDGVQLPIAVSVIRLTVTPSGDGHETISPDTPQNVQKNATQSFTVTANRGYTLDNTVGGTCPLGAWVDSVYTTGAITASCSVTFSSTPLPTRAYEEVINNDASLTTLLGININNTSDVLSCSLPHFTSSINSVVVSPDGSEVYAAVTDGGRGAVDFFSVTKDSLILTKEVILPGVDLYTAPAVNLQMALTPDGSALFITQYTGVGLRSKASVAPAALFRMDLSSDAVTAISDPNNILLNPRGLIVSPDSQTLYVGTDTDYLVALPVNADSINNSNKIVEGSIPTDDHTSLAINSTGNKLYVGNYGEGSVSVLTVNGMEASFDENILDTHEFSGASGLAVSPDGATLFVAEKESLSVVAVQLNTLSDSVQPDINGAFGLGLSPDGSKLYVTQAEEGVNTTTVLDAEHFFAPPSTIDIGGHSLTIGKFVGA